MVSLLPSNPLHAAELAVRFKPDDLPLADLRAACDTVRRYSRDHSAIAKARTCAEQIDRGLVA